MSILTDTKYLDEINFSGGSYADVDCSTMTGWTDADGGTGVCSAVTFGGKSCIKLDAVAAGGSNLSSINRDIGTWSNPSIISVKLYHSTLGTLANADYFELVLHAAAYQCSIRFASDGLYVKHSSSWNAVGSSLVSVGAWQEWTFNWNAAASGKVDVYLNGVLQSSQVSCTDATAGTTGVTNLTQRGSTVIGVTYVDWFKAGNTFRWAGETWTLQEGGKLTIRTDTRWHANSPASYLGSLGAQNITEGELLYDGTKVRWLPISAGSGDSPIGTLVTQGGVTGTYLGYWASLTSVPVTAIGGAGFLKFREVTGGAFVAGAITFGAGTGAATASGADKTGWIEIVSDDAVAITIPRLSKHTIRGDWFYLDDTIGSVGQQVQLPTNGGGAGTRIPAVWIETGVGSTVYKKWPALYGSTNGWSRAYIGGAFGETDERQNFVSDLGGGLIQIGEAVSLAATYANIAAQAGTYATISQASTYTWAANIITVSYATGHLLQTGHQVYLDFTSGDATTKDGLYTVTVLDPYTYTVACTGSGTGGNVTVLAGVTVTFTAHTLGVGDTVYCDFTSGSGVDGAYSIRTVPTANTYVINYAPTASVSGNVSVYSRYTITYNAHGLAIGNRVYLDFTSGAGVDGIYTIVAVAANTFDIVTNNGASADSGNVTIQMTIGNVPSVAGRKIRVPNVFLRGAATAARASNSVNAAAASRPNWVTTAAGAIDFEYAFSTWYHNFSQAYSVRHIHVAYMDLMVISECASALALDDVAAGMTGALDSLTLALTSNFAGGTANDINCQRGNTPGTTDHAISISYCIGQTLSKITAGIIQFVRSTGYPINVTNSSAMEFSDITLLNGPLNFTSCIGMTVDDVDYCDKHMGYANVTTPYYLVYANAACSGIIVDGVTWGLGGTVPNVHPTSGVVYAITASDITVKNVGTRSSMLSAGSWRPNYYGLATVLVTGGNCANVKLQRAYCDSTRTSLVATRNDDKGVIYEHVFGGMYVGSTGAIFSLVNSSLNSNVKGVGTQVVTTTGQSSVYGTHFMDAFTSNSWGRLTLAFNEPTTETESLFTMVSGTRKFNSSGGILMGVVGNQAVWEDSCFRLGHTGFVNTAPIMSGGTITNYTLEYDIDIGSGYSNSWNTLDGAHLSAITVNPAIGFKLKIRITTTTANLTAITYLALITTSTLAAQTDNLYPLSLNTLTLTGLQNPSEVRVFSAGTTTPVTGQENVTMGVFSGDIDFGLYPTVDIAILSLTYQNIKLLGVNMSSDVSIPVQQIRDRQYANV